MGRVKCYAVNQLVPRLQFYIYVDAELDTKRRSLQYIKAITRTPSSALPHAQIYLIATWILTATPNPRGLLADWLLDTNYIHWLRSSLYDKIVSLVNYQGPLFLD